MPTSSQIQLVNDANGASYAFLADNGALWQCQWNPQSGQWDKGVQIPEVYGAVKLQALYLERLIPSADSSADGGGRPANPGIVLAYRLGEGSGAEVYASFGGWNSEGTLSWSTPVQLTANQLEEKEFALGQASSQDKNGQEGEAFNLYVQTRQDNEPLNTTLDRLAAAGTDF